jgi:SHS2 domain-containing protein
MGTNRWEHFSHDVTSHRWHRCHRRTGFEQAALAMTAVITDPAGLNPQEMVEIACEAPDDELLFVDWLNVVFEMAMSSVVQPL